jgi:hypothetical protein
MLLGINQGRAAFDDHGERSAVNDSSTAHEINDVAILHRAQPVRNNNNRLRQIETSD